jgi:hypothetical protein
MRDPTRYEQRLLTLQIKLQRELPAELLEQDAAPWRIDNARAVLRVFERQMERIVPLAARTSAS